MRALLYCRNTATAISTTSCCNARITRSFGTTLRYISYTKASFSEEQQQQEVINSSGSPWRKYQLDRLEQSFSNSTNNNNSQKKEDVVMEPGDDDVVQPMWRAMERRVLQRKSLTAEQRGCNSKIGRKNIKFTDEDTWLEAGLYNYKETNSGDSKS
jgi:hypothetical protein